MGWFNKNDSSKLQKSYQESYTTNADELLWKGDTKLAANPVSVVMQNYSVFLTSPNWQFPASMTPTRYPVVRGWVGDSGGAGWGKLRMKVGNLVRWNVTKINDCSFAIPGRFLLREKDHSLFARQAKRDAGVLIIIWWVCYMSCGTVVQDKFVLIRKNSLSKKNCFL